jgi:type III pantothenate kinase
VTVDLLGENGRHLGGYILPGYGLGLASVAGLLPEELRQGLEPAWGAVPDPEAGVGRSTAQALVRGWMLGLAAAIERLGSLPRPDGQTDVQWWLTGGDGAWLVELLSRPARVEPDLVLEGLWLAALQDAQNIPRGQG